eukprot:9799024-Ditylum_brightwellii.AAC.1
MEEAFNILPSLESEPVVPEIQENSLDQIPEMNKYIRKFLRSQYDASKSNPATPLSGYSQTGESYTLSTLSKGRLKESLYCNPNDAALETKSIK